MSDLPILYSFRRCPYAMRARMAVLIAGQACEIREVKLSAKPEAMIAASEKATVPVLVLSDGDVLEESLDIMRWSLAQQDPEGWLERDAPELIEVNDGPLKHHLDRYKYSARHDTDPLEHRAAAMVILQHLEARLGDSTNLCGETRGIADMAIFPFVRQFAATDRDWFDGAPVPHLRKWLDRHIASPLFQAIMIKRQPWADGDEPSLFGEVPVAS
ncbi:glutathione S-transferase [Altererythrobacter sp. ZODW24]|uniref:glutathione S-transferase n=1 Tax=Altererythrobacter sp. ZODW24 TaxID=2185142 RepID=UPI000DF81E8E|nr:glutathione S-transferase [Altererythrobacter sp. ZODW24]